MQPARTKDDQKIAEYGNFVASTFPSTKADCAAKFWRMFLGKKNIFSQFKNHLPGVSVERNAMNRRTANKIMDTIIADNTDSQRPGLNGLPINGSSS
jgi:hypothetical protein